MNRGIVKLTAAAVLFVLFAAFSMYFAGRLNAYYDTAELVFNGVPETLRERV